jgi:hypothetical protein
MLDQSYLIIPPPSGIVASSRAGYRRWQRPSSARRSSATSEWSEPRCNQFEARQQAADADQNAANLIDDDRDQKSEGADAARDLLDLARSANPGAVRRDRHFRRGAIRHGDPRQFVAQPQRNGNLGIALPV